jgi:spermidine synthase
LLGYTNRMFMESAERIRSAYEGRALSFPSCDSGNTIAFAASGNPVSMSLSELKEAASRLKTRTGLNLHPALSRLEQAQTCNAGILTL